MVWVFRNTSTKSIFRAEFPECQSDNEDVLTLTAPNKNCSILIFYFYLSKKIRLAEDSLEASNLVFSEKQ